MCLSAAAAAKMKDVEVRKILVKERTFLIFSKCVFAYLLPRKCAKLQKLRK